MRIAKIEDLHCNAGWRDFSFLKITTDEGLVGWSEFMENFGAEGLSGVIGRLGERLIGMDPRPVEKITAFLHGLTRQTPYGINQQAIAAIENALVDIKAKALGIPVYELLGGPVRDRLRLYWSHCGTWRVSFADRIKAWTGFDPIRSLADVERAGAEVARRGFKGLKTNIMRFDGPTPRIHMPGFNGDGWPELNIDRPLVDAITAELEPSKVELKVISAIGDKVAVLSKRRFWVFDTTSQVTLACARQFTQRETRFSIRAKR